MKAISGREFARVLARHGWRLLRVVGSHHVCGTPRATWSGARGRIDRLHGLILLDARKA